MEGKSPLEQWRDEQNPAARGCGCAFLIAMGLLFGGMMFGAVMGDYIGPKEGAAQDARNKTITILLGFVAIVTLFAVGKWLITKRKAEGDRN